MGVVGRLWREQDGQDVAEHAVKLPAILAIAIATMRAIGSHAHEACSSIAITIQ